ncbi:response regulator transcription factor [Flagellimonas sp. HMM57]|uniref:response regulator transcription factor n=1 Tax=unclassified Flagellimonas TaxID=2644544 RepID=UPI0013D45D06|nr:MULTISPECIES: response regulator transcription factor [unclassified Flagellimonas]UII76875.1 response regulator transcription factor [Flagellimonas sp. HMM57]
MERRIRILLAEDELALGRIIKESLETRNFEVLYCNDGETAYRTYCTESPELLVLDVMMPKKDGFTLAKEIRAKDRDTPIIFLTAKSQTKDVVEGFGYGGNDYLKKPFSMEELIVRIHALLDRGNLTSPEIPIKIGDYSFNHNRQTLSIANEKIHLTHRESELLLHLSKTRNSVLDRSLILKKIWGNDDFFNARSMDVFITKLRKKLQMDPTVEIVNIRGYGYKLIC